MIITSANMFTLNFIVLFIKLTHVFCLAKSPTRSEMSDNDIRLMLRKILSTYDPKLRPDYLGPAVAVEVDATIISISKIDEVNMMYTLDMFFRQRWHDHRLKHNLNETLTIIVGTKQPADIIWVPDTVFIDSVTSNMHKVTVNNHKIDIFANGNVFWGTRVTVSPSCRLNLKAYPMDKQFCKFVIMSYAYTSRHIIYRWKNDKKGRGMFANDIKMAQFQLMDYKTVQNNMSYVAGNFTELEGQFHFERLMGFAIMQIYIPSICVVMVSWISLWVQRNAIPARVALCITTLLTISSFWSAINAQLPRVNYVKAIDIFMLTSFSCVIMTLIEFTVVLNSAYFLGLWNFKGKEKKLPHEMGNLLHNGNRIPLVDSKGNAWPINGADKLRFRPPVVDPGKEAAKAEDHAESAAKTAAAVDRLANKIENSARIFFPFTYATFLTIYFITFLNPSE